MCICELHFFASELPCDSFRLKGSYTVPSSQGRSLEQPPSSMSTEYARLNETLVSLGEVDRHSPKKLALGKETGGNSVVFRRPEALAVILLFSQTLPNNTRTSKPSSCLRSKIACQQLHLLLCMPYQELAFTDKLTNIQYKQLFFTQNGY